MSETVTFPNATAVVRSILEDALADAHVYSSLPKAPTFPTVVVQRIGGLAREKHALDQPNLQVSVWGRSDTEAHDVAQAARQALIAVEGTEVADAFITDVSESFGLTQLLDPVTGRDRYIFGVSVTLTAAG